MNDVDWWTGDYMTGVMVKHGLLVGLHDIQWLIKTLYIGGASSQEIIEKLRLESLESRVWHVIRTCALIGEGLQEAISLVARIAII